MGWLRLVGCLKIYVSLQNIGLFCRALLQKRPIFLSILLIVATPYGVMKATSINTYIYVYEFQVVIFHMYEYIFHFMIWHMYMCTDVLVYTCFMSSYLIYLGVNIYVYVHISWSFICLCVYIYLYIHVSCDHIWYVYVYKYIHVYIFHVMICHLKYARIYTHMKRHDIQYARIILHIRIFTSYSNLNVYMWYI